MAVRSIEELLEQLDAATAGHDAHACTQLYHPNAEAFTMFVIKEGDEWLIAAGRGTLPPKDPPPTGP